MSGGIAAPRVPTAQLESGRRAAELWWLDPRRIVLLGLLPLYLSFLFFDYARIVPLVYVPSWHFAWGAALLVALAIGAQAALQHGKAGATVAPLISRGLMLFLLGVTLGAYAIWFGPLLVKPQLLLEIVQGLRSEVRQDISTLPGITTFTQFGVCYAIAYAIKSGAGVQPIGRLERAGIALVFGLALFRAFAWAERLAAIELLVCFSVARMAFLPIRSPRRWQLAAAAPIVAPLLLYLLFTASEVNRSWRYYENEYASVWHFTFERLLTYYAVAANNGIGYLIEIPNWPNYAAGYTLEWLYRMPLLGPFLAAEFGDPRAYSHPFLETYARPEFNSPTALFRAVADFGYFGSALYFLALGYLIGRAYQAFRGARPFGLLLYPVFVLYLCEALRYSYLSEPRFIPLLAGLALVALDVRSNRRRSAPPAFAGMPALRR